MGVRTVCGAGSGRSMNGIDMVDGGGDGRDGDAIEEVYALC